MFYPHDFYQIKLQLPIKVLAVVFFINWIHVTVQPVFRGPNPKYFMMIFTTLPKVHWSLEKLLAISCQLRNDTRYIFGAGPVRNALSVFNSLINTQLICDLKIFKHSNNYIIHCVDHGGYLLIKFVDTRKLNYNKVLLSCH